MNSLEQAIRIGTNPAPYAQALAWIAGLAGKVRARLAEARHRREAEARLLRMNDRELRDIGLTRGELVRLVEDHRL